MQVSKWENHNISLQPQFLPLTGGKNYSTTCWQHGCKAPATLIETTQLIKKEVHTNSLYMISIAIFPIHDNSTEFLFNLPFKLYYGLARRQCRQDCQDHHTLSFTTTLQKPMDDITETTAMFFTVYVQIRKHYCECSSRRQVWTNMYLSL